MKPTRPFLGRVSMIFLWFTIIWIRLLPEVSSTKGVDMDVFKDERYLQLFDQDCDAPDPLPVPEDVLSPRDRERIVQILDNELDDGVLSFVELPPDTFFVESVAVNPTFDAEAAYVVVQQPANNTTRDIQSSVHAVLPGESSSRLILGPLTPPDGSTTDLSIWGSVLTSTGLLYACVYNRNSIMVFDLANGQASALLEIPDIAAPNDLALDPSDETVVYVAGGTFMNVTRPEEAIFSNPTRGQLVRVDLNTSTSEILVSDLRTLVGVEVLPNDPNKVWLSQLYNIITYDLVTGELQVAWDGNTGERRVWLADNLDVLTEVDKDNNHSTYRILTPAWGDPMGQFAVNQGFRRICVSTAANFALQLQGRHDENETVAEALWDPEVPLDFSATFLDSEDEVVPETVRVIVIEADLADGYYFTILLNRTIVENPPYRVLDPFTGEFLGVRNFFNEQVTHISHLPLTATAENLDSGYLLFVNFEQPRVMLLRDTIFFDVINSEQEESKIDP